MHGSKRRKAISRDAENPFDVLPLSSQIRRENYLVGLLPWFVVTIIEWFFLYMALSFDEPESLIMPLILEVVLLPAVLGYFAQIHTIRMFENLGRQIRFDEISLTAITGKDLLDWLIKMNRRVYVQGAVENVVLGLLPIMLAAWILLHDHPVYIPIIILTLYLMLNRFFNNAGYSVFSACLGFIYLFQIEGYFRSRIVGLMSVAGYWVAFILMTGLIFAAAGSVIVGMAGIYLGEEIEDAVPAVLVCLWIVIEVPLIAYFNFQVTSRNRAKAETAIQSWLRGEADG